MLPRLRRLLISREFLLLSAYLIAAGAQLFWPPLMGMADNGDFPKITGLFSLPPQGGPDASRFTYYVSNYELTPSFHWRSGMLSSEAVLAWAAIHLSAWINGPAQFDLRWLAAVHLAVATAAFAAALWWSRNASWPVRWGAPLWGLFCFTDAGYVAYFASFYMDAAALVFLFATVTLCIQASLQPDGRWLPLLYAGIAAMLLASKSQHSTMGLVLGLFACYCAVRSSQIVQRAGWIASALVLWAVMLLSVPLNPAGFKAMALYNTIFYKVLSASADPGTDLSELGLDRSFTRYVGTHSFQVNSPSPDPAFQKMFLERTSLGKLVNFYLRHPGRTLEILSKELRTDLPVVRPWNFANRRREDGFPPYTLAASFSWWSSFRQWALGRAPWLLVGFFVCCGVIAAGAAISDRAAGFLPAHAAFSVLLLLGVGEFCVASLADAIETFRHYLLFHVITDLLLIFLVTWALLYRRPGHPLSAPSSRLK